MVRTISELKKQIITELSKYTDLEESKLKRKIRIEYSVFIDAINELVSEGIVYRIYRNIPGTTKKILSYTLFKPDIINEPIEE